MPQETLSELDFGAPTIVDNSLADNVRGLIGSEILKIAADVRKMIASGKSVCNLTVGDFNTKQFPVPDVLLQHLRQVRGQGAG